MRHGMACVVLLLGAWSGSAASAQGRLVAGPMAAADVGQPTQAVAEAANLELTFGANPAQPSATPCRGVLPAWTFELTVTETSGVGATITSSDIVFLNRDGTPLSQRPFDFSDFYGSERVLPGASDVAEFCVHRAGATSGFVRIEVQTRDDRGNASRFFSGQLTLAEAEPVSAPRSAPRGFVSISGGTQTSSTDFVTTTTFTFNAENGTLRTDYRVESGLVLDVGVSARIGSVGGIGVSFSRFSKSSTASVTGSFPHPSFFNRSRQVSGDTPAEREELAVHVSGMLLVPASERVHVSVYGGPSYFDVKQELVQSVQIDDAFPFDAPTFRSAIVAKASERAFGFHAGADVTVLLGGGVGVGAFVRYSRASVDLGTVDGGTVSVDAGGLHAGGGLRLAF